MELSVVLSEMTPKIFRITRRQKSYSEVIKLLPRPFTDLEQTIIFVNDYCTAYAVAAAVRKFYGLSGEEARTVAPVYHNLKRHGSGGDDAEPDARDVPAARTLQETSVANTNNPKDHYQTSIGTAEYVATERCLVDVLGREFSNPAHAPCYDIGGCYSCKQKHQVDEKRALLSVEKTPKQEIIELDIRQYDFKAEETESHAQEATKQNERSAKDVQIFKEEIQGWRKACYMRALREVDIPLDALMTDKELKRVAKFKVTSVESFDNPEIRWESAPEWRQELLQVIKDLEASEARKLDATERIQEERIQKGEDAAGEAERERTSGRRKETKSRTKEDRKTTRDRSCHNQGRRRWQHFLSSSLISARTNFLNRQSASHGRLKSFLRARWFTYIVRPAYS
ncbi:hypothetical protein BDV93DRAFT_554312 [Ceratobasidium sp. AG-I]|nr:hypothetical protein BDV93DRAFT_554312 [Ceratobasidium sp. AG-I]